MQGCSILFIRGWDEHRLSRRPGLGNRRHIETQQKDLLTTSFCHNAGSWARTFILDIMALTHYYCGDVMTYSSKK